MAHFAEIDEKGKVIRVLVVEQEFIDTGSLGNPSNWIQTSYNSCGGIHYKPNSDEPSGQPALRKSFAGIGFTYDKERDAFIPPKPFPSWILNEETCLWEAPVPLPATDEFWEWNEKAQQWAIPKELNQETEEWIFE